MLDLDAVIDIDDPLFDLDGNPVGVTTPVPTGGAGGRHSAMPAYQPRLIVGRAAGELGPLDSSATLIRTLDIRQLEAQLLVLDLLP
jgi:hypothetical protein